MRCQRSGAFTTRRMDDTPRASRKRAIAPLAAIMKSSMRERARLFFVSSIPTTSPCLTTARASIVSRSSAPCS